MLAMIVGLHLTWPLAGVRIRRTFPENSAFALTNGTLGDLHLQIMRSQTTLKTMILQANFIGDRKEVPRSKDPPDSSNMLPESMLEASSSYAAEGLAKHIGRGIARLANMTSITDVRRYVHKSLVSRSSEGLVFLLVAAIIGLLIGLACIACMMTRHRDKQTSRFRKVRNPFSSFSSPNRAGDDSDTSSPGASRTSRTNSGMLKFREALTKIERKKEKLLQAGKARRGAGKDDEYRFGDVSRGIHSQIMKFTHSPRRYEKSSSESP